MKDRTLILGCSNLFGAYDENDKFDITTSWVYKYFDPEYTDAFGFPGHGTITFCQFVDFLGPRLQDYDNLIVLETLEPRIIAGDYYKPIKEVFAEKPLGPVHEYEKGGNKPWEEASIKPSEPPKQERLKPL